MIPAPPGINKFVRSFIFTNERTDNADISNPAKPTGCNYFGWLVDGSGKVVYDGKTIYAEKDYCHISGQIYQLNDITLTFTGPYKHIFAEFTPLGMYQLFGITGSQSVDQVIIVSPLQFNFQLSHFFNELIAKASGLPTTDMESRLELLQDALMERIPFALKVPKYLESGIAILNASNGAIKISELMESLDITERQFNRKFTELVGIPPKFYAKTLQINKAILAMMHDDRDYLTEVAQAAGFFDQPHFIRVMRGFFNSSPNEFLQSDEQTLFKFLGRSRLG